MKKITNFVVLAAMMAVLLSLSSCKHDSKEDEPENIVQEDGTIDLSELVDDVILKYNDWGTSFYSYLQSEKFNITELFDEELPKAGDTVQYYWKGKSNRDISKLHMLVVDIKYTYDEDGEWLDEAWTHLLTEKQITNPIATNIKAGEEFEIKGSVVLSKGAIDTINVLICCSSDDAAGPVHLYSTPTENTTNYDEYMTQTGTAIMTSGIEVTKKGKITFTKSDKTIRFTEYPEIMLVDGNTYDCSDEDDIKSILDNGYFFVHFWGDDFNDHFWRTMSNQEKNTCGHGGWGGIDNSFTDYNISDKFKATISGEPIYGECSYFARAAGKVSGTTEEGEGEGKKYYYFPVIAFDVVIQ